MKNNIILIGFMGSGKSSVGEALAKSLNYKFLDSDKLIEEKAGSTISQIFEQYGEEYFRNMETKTLQDMQSKLDNTVLSTGGGMPLREENSKLLRQLGLVVYLQASTDTVIKRLKNDKSRPLLRGDDLVGKVDKLLAARNPVYEKTAHKIIVTDNKTINQIVADIIEELSAIKED